MFLGFVRDVHKVKNRGWVLIIQITALAPRGLCAGKQNCADGMIEECQYGRVSLFHGKCVFIV